MNARVRAVAVVAVLASGLSLNPSSIGPRVALAQDASTSEARRRFQEGVKLFDEKKYDLARTAFLQAYALKRHPDILLNLAQCEAAGGRPLEAATHLRDFLRDPATSTHPKRVEAERGLTEARLKLGRVQVLVDATEAEILVDGTRVGTSPLSEAVDVMPGNHLIEARQGARTLTRSVNAPAGHIVPVDLRFGSTQVPAPPPPPTPAPPPTAPPSSTSPPAAEPPPAAPPAAPTPTPTPTDGEKGEKPGFVSWAFGSPLGLVGTGLLLGGVAVGGTFSVLALGSKGDAEDLRSQLQARAEGDTNVPANRKGNPCSEGEVLPGYESDCATASDKFDANKTQRTVATIGLAAAGVGLATLVIGYMTTDAKAEASASSTGRARPASRPERGRVLVAPALSPSFAGLGVGVRF